MADEPVTTIELSSLDPAPIEAQRHRLHEPGVLAYMADLDSADPIVVYEDGSGHRFLAAGHHRVQAATRLGRTTIRAIVRPGTRINAANYRDLRGQPD
jgi:ParB-like chromosome segregation protein Spo0J